MSTTTQPKVGPELDRAVAEAMGFEIGVTIPLIGDRHHSVWRPDKGMATHQRLPEFSTDPATQPELLAWLKTSDPYWTLFAEFHYSLLEWRVCAGWNDGQASQLSRWCSGATLNEALCRLVLAVAAKVPQP